MFFYVEIPVAVREASVHDWYNPIDQGIITAASYLIVRRKEQCRRN